jgi:CheY-like chemotaxis protein/HPt (histidine-containing phosphotransfer) domain-containing protein
MTYSTCQKLNNLLSNAFKYTTEGTVGLSITSEASKNSDDEVVLVVSVSDTGQGMTEEQINKLFDEYARFNQEANRSAEGTGLGMGITRNLIRLMNGDIQVESKPGKGSTFTVRLTQGRSDSGVLGKEIAENLHQFRTYSRARMRRVQISREPMPYGSVLIVDDVETNIYVAKGLLAPYGLKTDSANSAFAAIEEIKRGKKYDIIFMDHMMPEMDGVEATNILRKMGYEQPIVALTANAVSGQAGLFLENGFNDFISKPIDIRQLNIVLNKLIRDKQSPEVIEAARQQAEAKRELADNMPAPDIEPYFNEIFVRDAAKTLSVLNTIIEKNGSYDENDLRMYIIHTHGIKSALANIGKTELSAVALKLEQSGRDKNIEIIKSETPAFLSLLQTFVEELKLKIDNTGSGTINEDKSYLNEKLLVIKAACEEYDENTANKVITELRGKTWSEPTREFLGRIDEHLLHSNFEEIVEIINN